MIGVGSAPSSCRYNRWSSRFTRVGGRAPRRRTNRRRTRAPASGPRPPPASRRTAPRPDPNARRRTDRVPGPELEPRRRVADRPRLAQHDRGLRGAIAPRSATAEDPLQDALRGVLIRASGRRARASTSESAIHRAPHVLETVVPQHGRDRSRAVGADSRSATIRPASAIGDPRTPSDRRSPSPSRLRSVSVFAGLEPPDLRRELVEPRRERHAADAG